MASIHVPIYGRSSVLIKFSREFVNKKKKRLGKTAVRVSRSVHEPVKLGTGQSAGACGRRSDFRGQTLAHLTNPELHPQC